MKNVEELGATHADAYESVKHSVDRLQRTVMASILAMYPNRDELAVRADDLRDELGADAIRINVILPGKQLTIISCPDKATEVREIPLDSSLCVLAVGADQTLNMNDAMGSTFLKDFQTNETWITWASAPVRLHGQPVGTVCALGEAARTWGDEDEELMESTAKLVELDVMTWLHEKKAAKAEQS